MTIEQHNDMVHDIVNGTMCALSKIEKIDVIVGCLAAINDEPEYPIKVPIYPDGGKAF